MYYSICCFFFPVQFLIFCKKNGKNPPKVMKNRKRQQEKRDVDALWGSVRRWGIKVENVPGRNNKFCKNSEFP